MHRGFRFRLYPTPAQAETLTQWIGVTRLVYNLALEQRTTFWRQYRATEGKAISFASQCRELTDLRPLYDFIAEPPRTCLEQALRDLDRAFTAFFKGGGYPTWRKADVSDTLRCKATEVRFRKVNRRWSEVLFPKLGWLRFRDARPRRGDLLNVTITRRNGEWSIAFVHDVGPAATETGLPTVGMDRGVANTISLSTGEHISTPDISRLDGRIRKAQRVLARRKKGSRRRALQKARVARLRAKVRRIRTHWAHVTTTDIARRFGVVAIEDLNIGGMTAKGRGKRGLNRSILNQAWGQLASMLDYKLEAAGGRLVHVPAAFTSQTCSACGVVDRESRKSQATFACVHCGHETHADTNAALEIRRRSTALLLVEGGHVRPPVEARTLAA